MSSIRKSFLFPLVLLITSFILQSQDNRTIYWQPDVSVNHDVSPLYSQNFSLTNRNYLYQDQKAKLSVRQLDLAHFSKLKIDFDKSLGFGVQYRFRENFERDEENELRLTQQYNVTYKTRSIRLGNRLRSEQRITSTRTTHRFRYRFAVDVPLKGLELDVGEPYFIASTESLLSVGRALAPMYDQRLTSHIGWSLPKGVKLQLGIEYRLENYSQQTEQVFFFLNSLILSL